MPRSIVQRERQADRLRRLGDLAPVEHEGLNELRVGPERFIWRRRVHRLERNEAQARGQGCCVCDRKRYRDNLAPRGLDRMAGWLETERGENRVVEALEWLEATYHRRSSRRPV